MERFLSPGWTSEIFSTMKAEMSREEADWLLYLYVVFTHWFVSFFITAESAQKPKKLIHLHNVDTTLSFNVSSYPQHG